MSAAAVASSSDCSPPVADAAVKQRKRKGRTEAERLCESALTPPVSRAQRYGNAATVQCAIPYELESGGVPVFKPTMEQFKDFAVFIETVNAVGFEYGVVKVIPPAGFVPNASGLNDKSVDFGQLIVRNPARQHVYKVQGLAGAFQVRNEDQVGKQDFTVPEFFSESVATEANRSLRERKLADECDWAELERIFWKTTLSNAPLYGSDSPGSLFDMEVPWNVGNLPSLLHALPESLPGIKEPFLYWGTWRSMFSWHQEDVNLYSINVNHFGAPKQWYVIPPRAAGKFSSYCHSLYPDLRQRCAEFMRHKECLVSPSQLNKAHIPFAHSRQERGEYMVLWPEAYHQGFNYGLNCAESVNFATASWLQSAKRCFRCLCKDDTVWIGWRELTERLRRLQWLHREEKKRAAAAATADATGSDEQKSVPALTAGDVPASYELDVSDSIWLGLPTDPRDLIALRRRYFVDPTQCEAEAQGRSMTGRSMGSTSARVGAADGADAGAADAYTDDAHVDDDEDEEESGFVGDRNAVYCSYADCPQTLHKTHRDLMRHYQTVHSKEAREAAAAAAATAAAANSAAAAAAAAEDAEAKRQRLE